MTKKEIYRAGVKDLLDLCREYLDYNPDTGDFRWKKGRGRLKAGSLAGSWAHDGYRQIKINRRAYYAHRLAYLMVNGVMPPDMIDHIDQDRGNNKLSNLRTCHRGENSMNSKIRRDNTSGYRGVTWHKIGKKWQASICLNGRGKHLGLFNCKHEAARYYNTAARMYHGEFAQTNVINKED